MEDLRNRYIALVPSKYQIVKEDDEIELDVELLDIFYSPDLIRTPSRSPSPEPRNEYHRGLFKDYPAFDRIHEWYGTRIPIGICDGCKKRKQRRQETERRMDILQGKIDQQSLALGALLGIVEDIQEITSKFSTPKRGDGRGEVRERSRSKEKLRGLREEHSRPSRYDLCSNRPSSVRIIPTYEISHSKRDSWLESPDFDPEDPFFSENKLDEGHKLRPTSIAKQY